VLLASCSKNIQNQDAVRSAVVEYLTSRAPQTGLDMNQMQVEIAAVTFEKDTARATVSIKPKSSDAGGMEINYNLDRKGDKWVVRPGGMPHAMPGAVSGSGEPEQDSQPGSPLLPPGHPSVTQPSGQALPPGHPAVPQK